MTLAAQRMQTQGLVAPIGGVKDVVHRLVGLQAQDDWVAAYAVRPRAKSTVDAAAVSNAEGLIRTWVMRGTLHLVTREDAGWLVALLGPRFIAAGRRRREQLGLTEELVKQALPIVRDAVPATRAEIASAVRKRGLDLAEGQAEAHLVGVAAMNGLIRRTDTGYLPMPRAARAPTDPLRELARRYLAGYAPAGPEDFAAWSGLPLTEARQAFKDLPQPSRKAAGETVRLLGHWDPWLLGYKDRSFTLDAQHARQIQRGGGFLRPLIVADGKVVGTWTRSPKGAVVPEPFEGATLPDLDAEIEDLARFFSPSGAPGRPRP
jgi:DNA glycosylase AlkZ-like